MKDSVYESYELLCERKIDDLNSMSFLLKHKKSGARVAILKNDDKNKVFYIGFRTPPKDSTGVAHIIEHSVLCGSKAFPVKDPFVELAKGSLNTFLNAMTFPDKTVYPVASCNDKDFQNLMHVYMDAVFYPNIYSNEKIFMQEGWHYEMESADSDITINGVVYNEMKGAFSSPDDVNDREILNSLYPDTAYGVESGGDPDVIPNLTYEDFLEFHKKYYHPSNSYIFLYGDMDFEEKLAWLDSEYLSKYDAIKVDSFPGEQKPFEKAIRIEKNYPISDEENEDDNTYLSCNCVVGTSLDKMLYIAFQVIDYALVDAQGAPLKQALIDAGIGTEVYSIYENGIYQPYYSIVAKNANKDDAGEFERIINKSLSDIVANGFNKDALLAGVNSLEFRYREAEFGSYPRGLMLGLMSFDSWLYDDLKPFDNIECNSTYAKLKELIDTDYFEKLVETYLLDNAHKSFVMLCPEKGLTAKKEQALANKLAKLKASLGKDGIDKIVNDTLILKEYQASPDSEEDLAKIPMLTRDDLDKNIEKLVIEERKVNGVKTLYHNVFTNEIAYIKLVFEVPAFDEDTYQHLSLLKAMLGSLDTEKYSYEQLGYEINKHTGNVFPSINISHKYNDSDEFNIQFVICIKCLYGKIGTGISLAKEMIHNTKFEDYKRMKEILSELKSGLASKLMASGHTCAIAHGLASLSKGSYVSEQMGGIEFYRFLDSLEKNWDSRKEEFADKCQRILKTVLNPEKLIIDATMDDKGLEILTDELKDFAGSLNPIQNTFNSTIREKKRENVGYTSASTINYVALCGSVKESGLEYTGALKVLRTIMAYEYLWTQVRVKGGAYGCMSQYRPDGNYYFVSYRDPHLKETLEIYRNAPEYIRNMELDEKSITKYIIGTISNMDIPLSPLSKGERAFSAYFAGVTNEMLQKERDEVLNITQEDINNLSEYIKTFVDNSVVCTIGNDAAIKEAEDIFDVVEPLI